MPDPQGHPEVDAIRRVARNTLIFGAGILALKFTVYLMTSSAAALTDALESIINLVAAAMVMVSVWFANRPADREHPYGHGKVEFLAVGMEGGMILVAGAAIAFEGIRRLIHPIPLRQLDQALVLLAIVAALSLFLALYVMRAGKRYESAALLADGRHLLTDVISTAGVLIGLAVVRMTGAEWIDPVVALIMAAFILWTGGRLLRAAFAGLMDRLDESDDDDIRRILDAAVAAGDIRGYHKVRHRHSGAFHWVDMHLQMDGDLSVRAGHEVASRIEHQIEQALGQGNATAHVEPWDEGKR